MADSALNSAAQLFVTVDTALVAATNNLLTLHQTAEAKQQDAVPFGRVNFTKEYVKCLVDAPTLPMLKNAVGTVVDTGKVQYDPATGAFAPPPPADGAMAEADTGMPRDAIFDILLALDSATKVHKHNAAAAAAAQAKQEQAKMENKEATSTPERLAAPGGRQKRGSVG